MNEKQSEAKSLKFCIKCDKEKELSEFVTDKNAKDGYRNTCKMCRRKQQKQWRRNDTNGFIQKSNERIRRYRKTERGAMYQRRTACKSRAKKYNIPFDLDVDFLLEMYEDQDRKCNLSGEEMTLGKDYWSAVSVDKIDPYLGYIKSNVQLLTQRVNLMKSNLSNEEFITLIQKILKESSETISKESTLEVNASGSAKQSKG